MEKAPNLPKTAGTEGPPSYDQSGSHSAYPPNVQTNFGQNAPQYGCPPVFERPPQFQSGYGYNQYPNQGAGHGAPPGVNVTPVIVQAPAAAPVQQQQTVVVNNAQQSFKPHNFMGLAIFTLLCCNLPLGIIALIFSCMSDARYGDGDVEGARYNGRVSMWLSVVGILIVAIIIVVLIVMSSIGALRVKHEMDDFSYFGN